MMWHPNARMLCSFKEFLITWGRAHVKCQVKKAYNTIYKEWFQFWKKYAEEKLVNNIQNMHSDPRRAAELWI